MLARANEATNATVNYLATRFDDIVTVVEQSGSRLALARRRARRLGWPAVVGQLAFTTFALPVLARRGRRRMESILADAGLDTSPVTGVCEVESVNSAESIAMLQSLTPAVVVVLGTRIISSAVLDAVDCPFVNTHAGITPRYRGMHGGYWALTERRPDLVGTTVHLVDTGVDTGTVLGRAYFAPGPDDSIATYPYLHLVAGLPVLAEQVGRLLAGATAPTSAESTESTAPSAPGESRLWWHPTLAGYLLRRWRRGVR